MKTKAAAAAIHNERRNVQVTKLSPVASSPSVATPKSPHGRLPVPVGRLDVNVYLFVAYVTFQESGVGWLDWAYPDTHALRYSAEAFNESMK